MGVSFWLEYLIFSRFLLLYRVRGWPLQDVHQNTAKDANTEKRVLGRLAANQQSGASQAHSMTTDFFYGASPLNIAAWGTEQETHDDLINGVGEQRRF